MPITIGTGQGVAKDCVVGDRNMNRYAVFNGLMWPRRIDANGNFHILGVQQASDPSSVVESATPGGLVAGRWYAYVAVYASSRYTRPVAVADGSTNYTRGNPSNPIALGAAMAVGDRSIDVTVPTINQPGITHVLIYRSYGANTRDLALQGPFYYAGQGINAGTSVTINDGVTDDLLGLAVERDNYRPKAYRYAINANGYIFAGGNLKMGTGNTCTVASGSEVVTADGDIFYDGMHDWFFKLNDDDSGGVNLGGLYYARYLNANTIRLVGTDGEPFPYDGPNAGANRDFIVYLPGHVLQWSKFGEPEAWPAFNSITFEGEIMGIAQVPNQPLVMVFTDTPAIYVLDLNLIGTESFKTNKHLVSTEYTVSSHYSLVPVDGRIRGICMQKKCIIESDGTGVRDITSRVIPRIFDYLSQDANDHRNWHCAYDQTQHFFEAFVTFQSALRLVDFGIGQYTITGSWFFNLEKDLLSTGNYLDPSTGEQMVLGGTEGMGRGSGGIWGRIFAPNIWDDWILGGLHWGTISNVVNATTFDVDISSDSLYTDGAGLVGRWVMVADSNDEYAQIGYIQSHTASRITVYGVIGGLSTEEFSPPPQVGWKFYLGLIEMRFGPKQFEFGDPEQLKKVIELWCSVENHNDDNLPFFRLYRGYEPGYDKQMSSVERTNWDNTGNNSLLVSKSESKMESVPRWGTAWYDRSYDEVKLHSLTIVFTRL
jgi:hypothetical protein